MWGLGSSGSPGSQGWDPAEGGHTGLASQGQDLGGWELTQAAGPWENRGGELGPGCVFTAACLQLGGAGAGLASCAGHPGSGSP